MKIVYENKKNSIRFDELETGKVFFFEDTNEYGNYPYMSIEDIKDTDEVTFNAIDLMDGIPTSVNADEKIIPCEAFLTIK